MDSTETTVPTPHPVDVWLLPAPFDFDEDNWRAICITFRPDAEPGATAEALEELGRECDALPYELQLPISESLPGCCVRFEADVCPVVAALLLYRAAYLIRATGIPTLSNLIVLSDPDRVWSYDCEEAAGR